MAGKNDQIICNFINFFRQIDLSNITPYKSLMLVLIYQSCIQSLKGMIFFSSFLSIFCLNVCFSIYIFKKIVNKQLTNCVCLLNLACNCGITSRYFTNLWWCEGKKKWSFSRELCIWIYICEKYVLYFLKNHKYLRPWSCASVMENSSLLFSSCNLELVISENIFLITSPSWQVQNIRLLFSIKDIDNQGQFSLRKKK